MTVSHPPPAKPPATWKPYQEARPIFDRYMLALAVVFVGISAVVVATAVRFAGPDPAPLEAELKPDRSWAALCPGDTITQTLTMTLYQPAKYRIDVTFEDAEGAAVIFGGVDDGRIAHARPGLDYPLTIERSIPWTVPTLPAGTYYRTVGLTTEGAEAQPLILANPFTIAPTCDINAIIERRLGPAPPRLCCPYPTRTPDPTPAP